MDRKETIGKRVNLEPKNLRKLKILATLFEDETKGLNEKQKFDHAINKAISLCYSSKEVKDMLEL